LQIDWGDTTITTSAPFTHSYVLPGQYDITMDGEVTDFRFIDADQRMKIINIGSWGGFTLDNRSVAVFAQCGNLQVSAVDQPVIKLGAVASNMFQNCVKLNAPLNWDTLNLTSMSNMFSGCILFNQTLSWDTQRVTSMSGSVVLLS